MRIAVKDVCGTLLYGKTLGMAHYAAVCKVAATWGTGSIVVFDFDGVDHATASWFTAMFVPLYEIARLGQNDWYPVLVNFCRPEFFDELVLVADQNFIPFIVGRSTRDIPKRATIVGSLDSGQKDTLRAVLKYGEITGVQLSSKLPNMDVKPTAWNNRLKDLYDKRLLRRRKQGREQIYFPVVKEIDPDGRQLPQMAAGAV